MCESHSIIDLSNLTTASVTHRVTTDNTHLSISLSSEKYDDDDQVYLRGSRFVSKDCIPSTTEENSYQNEDTMPIIWLDPEVQEDSANAMRDVLNELTKLLLVYNNDEDCEEYIRELDINEQIILIVSGGIGSEIIPRIHDSEQINVIYVYTMNKTYYTKKFSKYDKVNKVITIWKELVNEIIYKQDAYRAPNEKELSLSVNVYNKKEASKIGYQSDANDRFIWMHLFIRELLEISPLLPESLIQVEKEKLLKQLFTLYENYDVSKQEINKFVNEYTPEQAIYWYTTGSPIFFELNKALREMNLKLLLPFRFFIVDIYNQLEYLSNNQSHEIISIYHVYRGQTMSRSAVLRIRNSIDGYISTNSFLSTTLDRDIAKLYTSTAETKSKKVLQNVLLEIDVDPTLATMPYAVISQHSLFKEENEVLFAPGTILKILKVSDDNENNDIYVIQLKLCDRKQKDFVEAVSDWKQSMKSQSPLASFGWLLLKTKQYGDIKKFYEDILKSPVELDSQVKSDCFQVLGKVYQETGNPEEAVTYHTKAINVQKSILSDSKWLAKAYSYLADAYNIPSTENTKSALKYYDIAVKLFDQKNSDVYQDVVRCYINMAQIYEKNREDTKELTALKKIVEFSKKILSKDPRNLFKTLCIEFRIHRLNKQYEDAVECLQKALKIAQKTLKTNDSTIGFMYKEIGDIYSICEEFINALSFYHKAEKIYYYSCSQKDPRNQEIKELIREGKMKLINEGRQNDAS